LTFYTAQQLVDNEIAVDLDEVNVFLENYIHGLSVLSKWSNYKIVFKNDVQNRSEHLYCPTVQDRDDYIDGQS